MVNLREKVAADLKKTLNREWELPVTLIDPDGTIITEIADPADPLVPERLGGQILYDIVRTNPDTGEEVVINKPVVTLRRAALSRVPAAGEKWIVKIPVDPSQTATLEDFIIDSTRPPEGGRSIGFIRLYLRRALQL